jgi:hypothetical protein
MKKELNGLLINRFIDYLLFQVKILHGKLIFKWLNFLEEMEKEVMEEVLLSNYQYSGDLFLKKCIVKQNF